ncbi:MAG TPA: hypothetical protein VNH46_02380 [Gemmatimonadales bacterium]|nr:hypothetical protein [Gemmatimonadales bacterium]
MRAVSPRRLAHGQVRAGTARTWGRSALIVAALVQGAGPRLLAQSVCRPPADSHEARTLGIVSVPLVFSAVGPPEVLPGFTLGLEAAYVPRVDRTTATPTICRPGKGPEHTNLLPLLPRPRLGLPLPLGLALQASWVPPVRISGVKANLFGFSLARTFGHLDGATVAVRAHATLGSIHAPVTCDDAALGDPVSECFRGTRSDDRYSPNILGADIGLGWPMAGGRLRPFVGGGYNHLAPRFQVNFTNQFGAVDRTRVEVNLDRAAFFGGASWQLSDRLGAAGEVYVVPADAVTWRLVVRQAIGP